jgi:two-component system sensor histidine kinase/response regulator
MKDFLLYARLESRHMEVSRRWVSIDGLLGELCELAALRLAGKDVRFVLEPVRTGTEIFTDGVKLRTILRNLITNAAKFTNRGIITLRVAVSGHAIRFAIEDTGPGILPAELEAIFEPFPPFDFTRARRSAGAGLGLALSRKLSRVLGGDVTVISRADAGSTFTLVLPATDADGNADLQSEAAEEQPPRRHALEGVSRPGDLACAASSPVTLARAG